MEENNLKIIGITAPYFFTGETAIINDLLSANRMDFLHVRKPFSTAEELEGLISGISPQFYPLIKLHDHFHLVDKFDLGGFHLNSRNYEVKPTHKALSKSLHSLEEIKELGEELDYFFISPVFDSFSKPGYGSKFNYDELSKAIKGKKAVALGGVSPIRFKELNSMGFYGAAMLSYFFPGNPE